MGALASVTGGEERQITVKGHYVVMATSMERHHPAVSDSCRFMLFAFRAMKDKCGDPYWQHAFRVMRRLEAIDSQIIHHAALLHDVVETGVATLHDLHMLGYDDRVIEAINIVSRFEQGRDRDRSYMEWIQWIGRSRNLAAVLVKYADLLDNNAPERVARLPVEFRGLEERYRRAIEVLAPRVPSHLRELVTTGELRITVSEVTFHVDRRSALLS